MVVPKFRAWDKEHKIMLVVNNICNLSWESKFIEGYEVVPDPKGKREYELIDRRIGLEDAILMQSTGLVDKNGKEVFEGDIVKVTDGDERTDFSDGGIGTICGLDELYMWYIDGQVQNGLFDINQEYYIDVIGNIYQNPELLEVKE